MHYKTFPIKTATACQLKWNYSTVFLTTLKTASCHRVEPNSFDLESFDFHNTKEKLSARTDMLQGQWPGHGCEHCKNIEDAGGISDRIIHLDFPGFRAPVELDATPKEIRVTPRILEIYFSNICNLKCVYCTPKFSSQINQENKKHGPFYSNGVVVKSIDIPEEFSEATEKMFSWLDNNVHLLDKLHVLGGEPFIQKETQRLLNFLTTKKLPTLTLTIFSNLTIDHEKFKNYVALLKHVQQTSKLHQINIIGSLDCWGKPAEYIRNGLDLELFEKNFLYLLNETNFILNINSTISPLSAATLPDLIEKINQWSSIRNVYWTMMKTGDHPHLHPTIFGDKILSNGLTQALDQFNTFNDPEKIKYKEYFAGILREIEKSKPSKARQLQLRIYLEELDRRRNTKYTTTFPWIYEILNELADPEGLEPPTADFEDRNSIQLS